MIKTNKVSSYKYEIIRRETDKKEKETKTKTKDTLFSKSEDYIIVCDKCNLERKVFSKDCQNDMIYDEYWNRYRDNTFLFFFLLKFIEKLSSTNYSRNFSSVILERLRKIKQHFCDQCISDLLGQEKKEEKNG